MEPSQGPQSVFSPLTLHHLRRHHNARGPGGERPGSGKGPADGPQQGESRSILLGAAPRDLSPGALGPRCHAARGRSQPHGVEERRRHLATLLRLAWSRGRRASALLLSRFLGPWRVRVERDLSHRNLQTEMEPKSRWPREAASGDMPAMGSAGAQELGGRPTGSKAHCHQQTACNCGD